MLRLSGPQLRDLRAAIASIFVGPNPEQALWLFLFDEMDVQLGDYTSSAQDFQLKLAETLSRLNAANRILPLLEAVKARFPEATGPGSAIAVLSALSSQDAGAAQRFRALETAFLMMDGLPFINRSRLRDILPELMDPHSPARVAVIQGGSLTGKSWSRHLIRAFCRTSSEVRLVMLDMEGIQPGNDPVVVWTELLKRLMPDRDPIAPPVQDTKDGQYVLRLVDKVCALWDMVCDSWDDPWRQEPPWPLIVWDHLEKASAAAVGPAVVDFAEALAAAAADQRLRNARVLLLGFPRSFVGAPELDVDVVAPREIVPPLTQAEIERYLTDVGKAIGRGPPPLVLEAAEQALQKADQAASAEDRRAALRAFSFTIGRHVSVLSRAT